MEKVNEVLNILKEDERIANVMIEPALVFYNICNICKCV